MLQSIFTINGDCSIRVYSLTDTALILWIVNDFGTDAVLNDYAT